MLLSLLCMTLAGTPQSHHDEYRSAWPIGISEDAGVVRVHDVKVNMGGVELTLDEGVAIPLTSGRTSEEWQTWARDGLRGARGDEVESYVIPETQLPVASAGYVFIGTGRAAVEVPDRASRWSLANRLTLHAGWEVSELEETVDSGVWTTPITHVLVYGAEMPQGDVVDPGRARSEAREARKLVAERAGSGDRDLAWQRMLTESMGDARRPAVRADVRTTRRLGVVSTLRPGRPLEEDQWFTVTWDPDARLDPFDELVVRAGGWKRNWGGGYAVLSAIPRDSGRPFRAQTEPVSAIVEVKAQKGPTNDDIRAKGTARLTIRAVEPVQVIELSIPRHDYSRSEREGWTLDGVTLADGTPLTWWDPASERTQRRSGWTPLILPERLQPGDEVEVVVEWTGGWRANTPDGWSTGLQDVVPTLLPGRIGNPWRFQTTVAVPVGSDLMGAVGGDTDDTWEEGGWRYVRAVSEEHDALWPDVAVGDWTTVSSPAVDDLPAVHTRLFRSRSQAIGEFAPEVRRVVSFYQGYLPPFPVRELEIFQAPTRFGGYAWIAPHGLVNLQQARTYAVTGSTFGNTPHLESGILAHEIAHQYFGHVLRPASSEDFWIAESFSEAYAVMYLGAAFGEDVLHDRMRRYRTVWEKDLARETQFASLTHPYQRRGSIIYKWGPYVLLHMLHGRIGHGAFFSAVDGLTRARYRQDVRTEDIQAAFEATSEQDLSDFFDFWIRGGFRPELTLTWSDSGDGVSLDLTSSVPFGRFDVPVVVRGSGTEHVVWVVVEDGRGQATVSSTGAVDRVELDPNHMVLATQRRVRRR